jgi:hypothetical protein
MNLDAAPSQPTWQELALAAGWAPPPPPEEPETLFTPLFRVGGYTAHYIHGFGVTVPELNVPDGSFADVAAMIATYHRWMPTQYAIEGIAFDADKVDWDSADAVEEALVTFCLTGSLDDDIPPDDRGDTFADPTAVVVASAEEDGDVEESEEAADEPEAADVATREKIIGLAMDLMIEDMDAEAE